MVFDCQTVTRVEKYFCRISLYGSLIILLKIMAFEKETYLVFEGEHFEF